MAMQSLLSEFVISPRTSWKTVRELEREYQLSHGQIRLWRKKNLITPDEVQESGDSNGALFIDEVAVQRCVNRDYRSRKAPKVSRSLLVPPAMDRPGQSIPGQLLSPGAPLSQAAPEALPLGFMPTAQLVDTYLSLRMLALNRGEIAKATYDVEKLFMTRWALHSPAFPWTQSDIDSYDVTLGVRRSRWHAMRYLKTLSLWAMRRYPNANVPLDFRVGKPKPPRHDVLTPEQENVVLDAIREASYPLWVYATVLTRTGCRGFELLDLDWDDLTPGGFMTKGRAKKTSGMVYFTPGIYELLHSLPEPHQGPVFLSEAGNRLTTPQLHHRLRYVIQPLGIGYYGPIGSYMFRHLYAERMKDRINIERLATIMRTSVLHLERTYGKHSDESFRVIVEAAHRDVWGKEGLE